MKLNRLTIRKGRLERLRTICLALPEATEKITWGDSTTCPFVCQAGKKIKGKGMRRGTLGQRKQ